ncbi:peptidase M61 [Leptobacterium sp. I13]|uniref:M61 family metallopeptidase n=1 Tax=Leptobacterium meishanense TaxID=3128904 RepID=UPI0030EEEF97
MKTRNHIKAVYFVLLSVVLLSCTPKINDAANAVPIETTIDLVNVVDDKVMVTIDPGRFTSETVMFYIPKTVPGTYSTDNYGQYIEQLTALDYDNNPIQIDQVDENTWRTQNGTALDKITYWVNDTYDSETEKEAPVFSPAGTNIDEGDNFVLNLHGFVGYFDGLKGNKYEITIHSPKSLVGYTTLNKTTNASTNTDFNIDVYTANRYFEVIDNPILYAVPNSETFQVNDIEVTLSVYSPTNLYKASDIKDDMEKMIRAQKAFLGPINSTKKYNILLYLTTMEPTDAQGLGALEHHTSTTVVLPEAMPKEGMVDAMINVVAHEFFHIVTPLTIHSEEIHYFDYNNPKMSEHLWMYEGVTEYFAKLFQIQQGLIDEAAFYKHMMDKIDRSKIFNDASSFTEMSKNVLKDPYKDDYANVYEKGALIGMCIDILVREESNGEKGILWLMKQLSNKYGREKPFKDENIVAEIIKLTYPSIGDFFAKHVIGGTPIPYETYLGKAGLMFDASQEETGYFLHGQNPFINVHQDTGEIFFRDDIPLNSFLVELGVKGNDIIKSINGMDYSLENIRDMIGTSFAWNPGDEINMVVLRDGEEVSLKGTVSKPTVNVNTLIPAPDATEEQLALRNAWMKGI